MANETAWLIENSRGALCLGLCNGELAWVDFSDADALRFARQTDGLRMRHFFARKIFTHIAGSDLRDANVNEHMWCDAPSRQSLENAP